MGHRARNFDLRSSGRTTMGVTWTIPYIATSTPGYFASAVSITAAPSGTAVAIGGNFTKVVQSILVIIGGTFGATSFNVTLVGENQFGEIVSENIAFTSATALQSLFCYRKLTSVTINNVVGTIGAATISVGQDALQGAVKIPMLAKLAGTATVLSVCVPTVATAATQPTFTVTMAPQFTINPVGLSAGAQSAPLKVDLLVIPTVDPLA